MLFRSITVNGVEHVPGNACYCCEIPENTAMVYQSVELWFTSDAILNYPVFPYSSYMQKQSKNYKEGLGIITVEMDYNNPCFVFQINAGK